MSHLSQTIKELRIRKGLTQKQLAEIVGLKYQSIQKWEKGTGGPTREQLPVVSKALGVTVNDLLDAEKVLEEDDGIILEGNVKSVRPNSSELYVQVPFLSAKAQAELSKMIFSNSEVKLDETYPVFVHHVVLNERHIVIEVTGNEMEPEIKSGAIVLAERISADVIQYESGGVYAIIYANRIVVRRIKTNEINLNGTLTLWSENERYGNITLKREDIICMWKVLRKVDEVIK